MSIRVDELVEILNGILKTDPDATLAACTCAEELLIMDKRGHEITKVNLLPPYLR